MVNEKYSIKTPLTDKKIELAIKSDMALLSLGIYTLYFTQYAMLPPPYSPNILCANHIYIFSLGGYVATLLAHVMYNCQ